MKLSLILEVIEKGGNRLRKMAGDMKDAANKGGKPLQRALEGVTKANDKADTSLRRSERELPKWARGAIRAADAADRLGGRLKALAKAGGLSVVWLGLKAIEKSAKGAGAAMRWAGRKAVDFLGGVARWGSLAAGAGIGWLIGGTIGQASKFEQFQVVLENTEGSAEKARKAMDWVKTFAKTTPYEIGDVMEAFVALKAYGIDPVNGSLTSLGNAASGMGKPLMQAIEMLADAQTGEFERLKEFGVRAKVTGNQVAFTYMRAGKEITKTAKNSAAEINSAVLGIFDQRFGGMMDRQSRTLAGMWSNIKDMFSGFQLDIADAGFFDTVKGELQKLLDWINARAKDGSLEKWAKNISTWLETAIKRAEEFAEKTDWKQLGEDAKTIGRALWGAALALAKIVELSQKVRPVSDLLNPVQGSLNAAGRVYDWWTKDEKRALKPPAVTGRQGMGPVRPGAKPALDPNIWGNPSSSMLRKPTASAAPVKDALDINLNFRGDVPKGMRTEVASTNRDNRVRVNRGSTMAGAA